jgi:hypothetical protein
MFEYLGTIIGMHIADAGMSTAEATEKQQVKVVQSAKPAPRWFTRDAKFQQIRKRFEQQLEEDKNTPDPHADMCDPDWINKP